MSYHCHIKTQAAQPVMAVRTRTAIGNLPRVIGEAYGAVVHYLGELGEAPVGPPFVAYFNMDMQDLDIQIGFPVSHTLPDRDGIKAGEIPAGQYAACLHIGPYHQIGDAYAALNGWMQQQGCQGTGEAYEVYLNDPAHTPPEALQTEVLMLLKPVKVDMVYH